MNEVAEDQAIKVSYKYIPKRVYGITNKNHILYDGKLDGAIDRFHVLRHESGSFRLDLTAKDKLFLKKGLGISDDDLNTNIRANPYLKALYVEMPKAGITLDLSKPNDFLLDKVLQAYDNVIAPNLQSKRHKASYRYVRIFAEDEIDLNLMASDVKKEVYKLLGALEESRPRMLMYLLNEGKRVHPAIKLKELKGEVNKTVELSHAKFLKTLKDPLFDEKGMLNMAVIVGVVEFRSNLYFYEQKPLASEGDPSTLKNAAVYIKGKKQGPLRVSISKETMEKFNIGE